MIINSPTRDDIPALRALWREAFGDGDAFLDIFFRAAFAPERARAAKADGEILGALYWFDCAIGKEKYAYIYAVATKKAQRGKGVCTALMNDTHTHLAGAGYAGVVLVPGTPSLFEFYKKMGYKTASSVSTVVAAASDTPCDIREISKEEYAHLRRKYLPRDGVIQEGENLNFLERLATLYQGEDFILAAHTEGDILVGLELLGNTTAERAGAISSALGKAAGRFRIPGDDKPFAMHLPLAEGARNLPVPKYFGLAFD